MTANVFADDVKACLDAGMNSHVGKPLDMKVLIGGDLKYTRRALKNPKVKPDFFQN